jgi:hypothetical protein
MARSPVELEMDDPVKRAQQIEQLWKQGVYDGVKEATFRTERRAKQNTTDLSIVDRGQLRSSINSEVRVTGRGGSIIEGKVFPTAIYGIWVEFGRRGKRRTDPSVTHPDAAKAAFPPLKVIQEWVRRKNPDLQVSGTTASGRTRRPRQEDIEARAYLVGRAIEQFGIKARPYLVPAWQLVNQDFRKILIRRTNEQLRRAKGINVKGGLKLRRR